MAGIAKEGFSGIVNLTPHKIAVCQLIQYFAPGVHSPLAIPFKSISQHNRLGLFLLSLTRACDDYVEPSLDQLITQFKAAGVGGFEYDWFVDWLSEDLTSRLSSLSSPDDLYNFFEKLRGILSPADVASMEDEQCFLDPSSHLGVFIRCCILAFSILTFEGVCHLLSNMTIYCNATDSAYGPPEDVLNDDHVLQESFSYSEHNRVLRFDESETRPRATKSSFHIPGEQQMRGIANELLVDFDVKFKLGDLGICNNNSIGKLSNDTGQDSDYQRGIFLRSKWQIQGYLNEQANLLERGAGSLPFNSFETSLRNLQKMAPDLHHVKYLRYLNNLYNDDYISAMENLHRYYDYSAGMEGIFTGSSEPPLPGIHVGRYESALLCLGIMHTRFGHSKQALEGLSEAVRISQQNNDDSCLSYTLSAICDLLSKIGISSNSGIIGSRYSLGLGTPLSTKQQLLVLLKRSLKRAENLKLTSLLAFSRLAHAAFHLKHVERPVLSSGPKALTKLRTEPKLVCKELRLTSYLLSEFASDALSPPNEGSAFSTAWLKNLEKSITSPASLDGNKTNDYNAFHFSSQPNPIPVSVLQLAGASYLLRATSWELYGSATLVRANTLVYLSCFADSASSSELSMAYCKLIQHQALFNGYKEALNALKLAEAKFSSLPKSPILVQKLQLIHERALHRGELKIARQVCDELGILASSTSGVDLDLKVVASIRLARTLLAAKQFNQAATVAGSLFSQCYKFNLHIESASVLLLLAEIHKKSGNAVLGLSHALASLSFCRTFNLDLLEASAILTIAELWLSLGCSHAKRASSLLHHSLPMIFGHGGLELRARANITLVKCHLCDPSFVVADDPDIVLDPLRQAAKDLETLEFHEMAAEAFYLTALIYNAMGQMEGREEASSSFKKHMIAFENAGSEEKLWNEL